MSTQITLTGVTSPTVQITPAAHEAKRVVLAAAAACTEVVSAETQQAAITALAQVKSLLDSIETARTEVKAPILAAGKQIDKVAKNFVAEMEIEKQRLEVLVGAFQEAERVKAARAKADAERAEKLRLSRLQQEEEKRVGAESKGRTGTLIEDLSEMREKAAEDVAAIRQDAADASVAAPTGTQVRRNWQFEVTDINALFAANPHLCTIEPNNAAIRAVIKHNQKIPGLRIWCDVKAVVSAAVAAPALNMSEYDY